MKRFAAILGLLLSLASCQPWYYREPLETYYEDLAQFRLEVDWLNHMEEKPSGMTALLAQDGDAFTWQRITNNVDSMYLRLGVGEYKLLIFNHAFDEFPSMHFENQNSYSQVTARADNLTSRLNQAWDRGVIYMKIPDELGVAVDTIVVTQKEIDDNLHFIDYRERQEADTISIVRRETVYAMTCRLNIYVRVQGFKFMRSVEGSISGMADGCNLSSFRRTLESGPHFLDGWKHRVGTRQEIMEALRTKSDDPLPQSDTLTHDWITNSLLVFGLPGEQPEELHTRDPKLNVLTLCFTLVDKTTHVYSFDVGNWFRYRDASLGGISGSRGNLQNRILDLDLVIDLPQGMVDLPYAVDPGEGGTASAFDVIVDDWEEGDIIDVGL